MKKTFKSIFTLASALIISIGCLSGCVSSSDSGAGESAADFASGGVIVLSVNPEISVSYDKDGNVTEVKGLNSDGSSLLQNFYDYEGKPCNQVISEIVTMIGEAGYFVEEIEGEQRQITIEIEPGSSLPYETFFDDVVGSVKYCVDSHDWKNPINVMRNNDIDGVYYDDFDDLYDDDLDDRYDDDLDDRYDDDLDDRYDDDFDDYYDDDYYDDDFDDFYDDDFDDRYDDDFDDSFDDYYDDDYYDDDDDYYDDDDDDDDDDDYDD